MSAQPRSKATKPPLLDVPDVLYDLNKRKTYEVGKFLGKGGFARCYEVVDRTTKENFACKIVNKSLLVKEQQKEKMTQEIMIHRSLSNEYVVGFKSYFEDDANVYIVLELCGKKSLMELQKRRRVISEPEARYFLRQIVLAVCYIHDKEHIIHRDLKLGNIFVTDEMKLKIGDFGLATMITKQGERKRTLCGTPNYIAPEVLNKNGHSYEVDIWSMGCILYTLLYGRPPFETSTLNETYLKIRKGDYHMPNNRVSPAAKNLIAKMLMVDPSLRPAANEVLNHEFFMSGFIPRSLPISCLTTAPRFDKISSANVRSVVKAPSPDLKPLSQHNPKLASPLIKQSAQKNKAEAICELTSADIMELLKNMSCLMHDLVVRNKEIDNDDDLEDPNSCPFLWVSKWVDYSDKYGFGYQLSDDSIGVSFNDQTKMVLLTDGTQLIYIEKNGNESYYTLNDYPHELQKKIKLLNYFQQYMKENLIKSCGGRNVQDNNALIPRLPNLWTWFRTSRSVVMVLSNGTVQINNFRDHTKMILCPLLGAISILGSNKHLKTYKLNSMLNNGCSAEMLTRLRYACEKIEVIMGNCK